MIDVDKDIARVIHLHIPSLLVELEIPYSIEQMELEIELFDNFKQKGLQKSYTFGVDFVKDEKFIMSVYLHEDIAAFLIDNEDLLRGVLAHELTHYYEYLFLPEQYKFHPSAIYGVENYKSIVEFFYDDMRDVIVNSRMPANYLHSYQTYFFLVNGVLSHHEITNIPIKTILKMLGVKTHVKFQFQFISLCCLFLCLNTLKDTPIGERILFLNEVEMKGTRCFNMHESLKTRMTNIFAKIKAEQTIHENLELYNIKGMIEDADLLPLTKVVVDFKIEHGSVIPIVPLEYRASEKTRSDRRHYKDFRKQLSKQKKHRG